MIVSISGECANEGETIRSSARGDRELRGTERTLLRASGNGLAFDRSRSNVGAGAGDQSAPLSI